MHILRLTIENIRSIRQFEFDLRRENPAGWHVMLGDNGAGKSTVVRALALALMGESNAHATRQDWSRWLATGSGFGQVTVALVEHEQDQWRGGRRVSRGPITVKASIEADTGGSSRNGYRAKLKFVGNLAKRIRLGRRQRLVFRFVRTLSSLHGRRPRDGQAL